MTSTIQEPERERSASERHGPSRRQLIAGGAATAVAAGVGGYALNKQLGSEADRSGAAEAAGSLRYPFRGDHQEGIATPMQDHLHFTTYDVKVNQRSELIALLTDLTLAAERMSNGDPVASFAAETDAAQADTGEALDLAPHGLTITFGFGRSLFQTANGKSRFGIGNKLPEPLAEGIATTPAEFFTSDKTDGDLCIQACANDPQVAMHAIRNLNRIAFGKATPRWSDIGFGRASSTAAEQVTPRNLFGFKDGTNNLRPGVEPKDAATHMWINSRDDGGDWAAGGSYLAFRKFRMRLEMWDDLTLGTQEETFGRTKAQGAPLSGGDEFTPLDFGADRDGEPLISGGSHVALVSPAKNGGARMNRRSYNYSYGLDRLGLMNSGLHFIAFVRDPRAGFNPILQRMIRNDQLMEYVQQVGSGLFLCPPGVGRRESYVGQRLLES